MAFAQNLELRLGQNFSDVGLELGIAQVAELDGDQVPVHAQHGRHPNRKMQVRAALGHP